MNLEEHLIKQTILSTWDDIDIADLLGLNEREYNQLMDQDPELVDSRLNRVVHKEGKELVSRGLVKV